MRRRQVFAALALAASVLAAGTEVFAQGFSVTTTVDENGNGTFMNTTGFSAPLPFAVVPDPGPGGLAAALTYDLLNPPGLVAGDLFLLEPNAPPGTLSDLIRFNTSSFTGGSGSLVFYSDRTDGADALADVGFPTDFYANTLTVTEVGPEGNNGFTYTPTAGQPGFVADAAGPVTYVIRSDLSAVPEPGSLLLGSTALVLGLAAAWVRRGRKASAPLAA